MKVFTSIVLFSLFSTFTFAQDSFTQQEIESLFLKDSQPLELIALSDEEMKTTEGAWVPLLALRVGMGLTFTNLTYLNAPGPKDPVYSGRPWKFW